MMYDGKCVSLIVSRIQFKAPIRVQHQLLHRLNTYPIRALTRISRVGIKITKSISVRNALSLAIPSRTAVSWATTIRSRLQRRYVHATHPFLKSATMFRHQYSTVNRNHFLIHVPDAHHSPHAAVQGPHTDQRNDYDQADDSKSNRGNPPRRRFVSRACSRCE